MLESLRLCNEALRQAPEDADALNLMGRLCALGGDFVGAVGLHRHALRIAPDHERARADLQALLASVTAAGEARAAFDRAVALAPDIAWHACIPGSLPPLENVDDAGSLLEEAVRCDPSLAEAHAAQGNVFARCGRMVEALAAYRRALLLDPDRAEVQLATAELEHNFGDDANAAIHREAAFTHRTLYPAAPSSEKRLSVLVLARCELGAANVPLDFIADRTRLALHRMYVPERDVHAGPGELPHYDLVFNSIAQSEAAAAAIAQAEYFIASQSKPAINHPRYLRRTARPEIASVLRGIAGCAVPATVRCKRDELGGVHEFPAIVRPVDSHAGRDLERVDDVEALIGYAMRHPDPAQFDVAPFVEYRDDDGFYRKYRILFVDGVAYPYHLAISAEWIVHYNTSSISASAAFRAEEQAFLEEPRAVFASWSETTASIASAVGLDYFGIDCARTREGAMLVFEADASSWVHDKDPAALFPYKPRAVERIRAAVTAMLFRAAGREE